MAVTDLRNALLEVLPETYHYIAPPQKPPRYIVWGETNFQNALDADNETQIVLVSGELWFYTTEEYDTLVHDIVNAFDSIGTAEESDATTTPE